MDNVAQHHNTIGDIAMDAVKAAPPVSVTTWTIAGHQPSELLVWLTIIYTVLMIAHRIKNWNRS